MNTIHISGDPNTILLINTGRKWLLWAGVLLLVLGFAAVLFPFAATIATELFIGCLFILAGCFSLLSFFAYKRAWPVSGAFIISLLTIALGFFLIFKPAAGALVMTILIAIVFVMGGLLSLLINYRLRPGIGQGWLLLSALASIAAGLIIGFGLHGMSQVLLGLLVGINFILSGLSCVVLAQSIKVSDS